MALSGPTDPQLPHGCHQSAITTLTSAFIDPASFNTQLHDLANWATNCIPTRVFQTATNELLMDGWQFTFHSYSALPLPAHTSTSSHTVTHFLSNIYDILQLIILTTLLLDLPHILPHDIFFHFQSSTKQRQDSHTKGLSRELIYLTYIRRAQWRTQESPLVYI